MGGWGGSFIRALKVSLSDGLSKEVKTIDLNIQMSLCVPPRALAAVSISNVYEMLCQLWQNKRKVEILGRFLETIISVEKIFERKTKLFFLLLLLLEQLELLELFGPELGSKRWCRGVEVEVEVGGGRWGGGGGGDGGPQGCPRFSHLMSFEQRRRRANMYDPKQRPPLPSSKSS